MFGAYIDKLLTGREYPGPEELLAALAALRNETLQQINELKKENSDLAYTCDYLETRLDALERKGGYE